MSRPPRPAHLPVRDGVGPSSVALPPGAWPLVLDFLAQRLPALDRSQWQERMAAGQVLTEDGRPLPPDAPYAPFAARPGQRLHYWRHVAAEPPLPASESIVYQDEWLVIADKPHFMPVTPSGSYVRQSLLARLHRRLGLPALSPIHRIDRDTAGLIAFAVQPATRAAYQQLFARQQVGKLYEAIAADWPASAPPLPHTHRSRLVPHSHFFTMHEQPGAPNSHTRITRLRGLPGQRALYALEPLTGRRHQLRAHMAALGVPLEGDPFYPAVTRAADQPDDWQRPLQLLARRLTLRDPHSGLTHHFESRLHLSGLTSAAPAP